MSKRLFALLLALVLCVGMLAACGGKGDETTAGKDDTKGTSGTDDTTAGKDEYVAPDLTGVKITMYMPNNKDYNPEGSYVNTIVEKHLGLDLNIYEDETGNAVTNMLSKHEVPDLVWNNGFNAKGFTNVEEGAYINILDYLDKMPNVKAFLESPEAQGHIEKFMSEDGKTLAAIPVVQVGGNAGKYGFLYRKDIFEANKLTFPTNQEEFVQTLRDLKKLYPDSYPFIMRQMTGSLWGAQSFGFLWGGVHVGTSEFSTLFTMGNDGKYYLGATSQAYKEMAQFFKDMMAEGLMNPSSMTVGTADWTAAFSSGTSFIGYDKVDRIPSLETAGKGIDEKFEMGFAAPFNFGTYAKTATKVVTAIDPYPTTYNYQIGDGKNLENVLKYVDWLYSDEAYVMTNWGIEGESYVVNSDGTKSFKEGFLEKYHETNGLIISGLWAVAQSGRTDFDAYVAAQDEEMAGYLEIAAKTAGGYASQPLLKYNEVENLVWSTYAKPLYDYALAEYSKFIMGERDFADWDNLLSELKSTYHYDELLKMHEDALARVKAN